MQFVDEERNELPDLRVSTALFSSTAAGGGAKSTSSSSNSTPVGTMMLISDDTVRQILQATPRSHEGESYEEPPSY